MIKYLGSKRRLVPVIAALAGGTGASTALDLFSGSARVAAALKATGLDVTAVDRTRAAHVLASCAVATDADRIDHERLAAVLAELDALPGVDGYVTETFCRQARFFQPENGQRIDAIRGAIDVIDDEVLRPVLLTALLQAADRVDSTTGVQMAYLKTWAPRSSRRLTLRAPDLLSGPGRALQGRAEDLVDELHPVDVAYLDPPYNQHRYESNYHVWETIVAADEPEAYGVARKRIDLRDPAGRSAFNQRRAMPLALASVIERVKAGVVIVSVSDEAWVPVDDVVEWCSPHGAVRVVSVGQARYVGARIGIHNPAGERVGRVSHTRLREFLVIAGPEAKVDGAIVAASSEIAELDGEVTVPDRTLTTQSEN
ncbi:MAG: DNA adenine methylase [Actinomycetota bacterium]